jgi:hypothetical protein
MAENVFVCHPLLITTAVLSSECLERGLKFLANNFKKLEEGFYYGKF